jgi:hypothetical protein
MISSCYFVAQTEKAAGTPTASWSNAPAVPMRENRKSALACLETRLGLVDDIGPATAANHAVVAVAALEGLERIDDFHRIYPSF